MVFLCLYCSCSSEIPWRGKMGLARVSICFCYCAQHSHNLQACHFSILCFSHISNHSSSYFSGYYSLERSLKLPCIHYILSSSHSSYFCILSGILLIMYISNLLSFKCSTTPLIILHGVVFWYLQHQFHLYLHLASDL